MEEQKMEKIMIKRFIIPTLILLAVFATACAQQPPTLAPVDMQNTAVAAAWTMVAATQLAMPTNTLPPPTETPSPTPMPTFTPFLIPTATFQFPPTATQAASDPGNCVKALNVAEAGPRANIRITNQTGTSVNLSLNLWEPNAFGQCGALSWGGIKKNQQIYAEIPKGSWYAYSWTDGGGTASVSFVLGNTKNQDIIELKLRKDIIKVVFP